MGLFSNIISFVVTWDPYYLKSEAEQDAGKPLSVPTVRNKGKSIQDAYQHYGITHGTPGSATESDVRAKLNTILRSGESKDNKLDALEALHWYTVNNVQFGGASNVLEEVDRATEKVLYEAKK